MVLGALVCAGLVGSAVTPAWAGVAAEARPSSAVLAEGVVLVDGMRGTVSERDGAFTLPLQVGGLDLVWDSRRLADESSGVGAGWAWNLLRISTDGGTRVALPDGVYEADASHPTGLAGYGRGDVRFSQQAGRLPGRHGLGEVDYRFVLHRLGADTTYFNGEGDAVASISATGARVDREWDAEVPHRLRAVIDADGVETRIEWHDEVVRIERGANLPVDAAPGTAGPRAEWRLDLDARGRISTAHRPAGGAIRFGYAPSSDVLESVSGVGGGETSIGWRDDGDGPLRVERVRTTDAGGRELAARTVTYGANGMSPTGWPARDAAAAPPSALDPGGAASQTAVTEGATTVISEFDAARTLVTRKVVVADGAGQQTVHEQRFSRPGTGAVGGAALAVAWALPMSTETVLRDAEGGARSETEHTEYDEFGRVLREVSADGRVTERTYDAKRTTAAGLPVEHPLTERVTAPDRLVTETRHELDAALAVPVRTETWEGRVSADGTDPRLALTARTERVVTPDGFVTEERAVPVHAEAGETAGDPVITRRSRNVDLTSGTVTTIETTAAGTAVAATTSDVRSLRHGQVVATTDAAGNTTTSAYDGDGRVVERRDAADRVTRTAYQPMRPDGRAAVVTSGADGVVRTELTDALGRLVEKRDDIRDGEAVEGHVRVVETRTYPSADTVVATDAWGASTTTRTDVFGRVVAVTDASGVTHVTEYDDVANTSATGATTTGRLADAELVRTEARDAAGEVVRRGDARADGGPAVEERSSFDGAGRLLSSSDGGVDTHVSYDALGRPATTTLTPSAPADGAAVTGSIITAEKRFDGFGETLEKVLSDGTMSRSGGARRFDAQGRPSVEVDQLGRVTTTTYTPDGLALRIERGSGQVTEHTYDQTTRALIATVVTAPGAEPVRTSYEHDRATGELIRVWDPAHPDDTTITYEHDDFGNVTAVRYPDGNELVFRHDEHGRRTATVDVDGNVTELQTSPAGVLQRATQRDERGELLAEVAYERDDHGRIVRLDRDNGVSTAYTYTSASEIEGEHTTRGGATLSKRDYTYDGRGNLLARTDRVAGAGGIGEIVTSTSTSYGYDPHDRLVRSIERAGAADAPAAEVTRDTAYEVSVSGDILTETVVTDPATPSKTTTKRAFEYSPVGELTAVVTTVTAADGSVATDRKEQVYDAAGSVLRTATGRSYTWDAANRPVTEATDDGTVIRTSYWADGSRRARATDDAATSFYWDGAALVNERHTGASAGVAAYLLGERRHARSATPADDPTSATAAGATVTSHYGTDRHGNITDLTSAEGEVTERYTYGDYGVETRIPAEARAPGIGDLDRNPYGYSGEYTDTTGTQHLQTREYEPPLARFISMDREHLHNLYAYADLNPIMKIDPTGRSAIDADANLSLWATIALTVGSIVISLAGVFSGGLALGVAMIGPKIVAGWVMQGLAIVGSVVSAVDVYGPQILGGWGGRLGLEAATILLAAGGSMLIRAGQKSAAEAARRRLIAIDDSRRHFRALSREVESTRPRLDEGGEVIELQPITGVRPDPRSTSPLLTAH